MDRIATWAEKGRAKVSLLTLDLPISKSGLQLHYSPLFRLTTIPGSFRVASYEAPKSAAFKPVSRPATAPVPASASISNEKKAMADAAQELVSHLQQSARGSRPTRNLPIRIAFPHLGPSIFLMSELTSENQTPSVELDFQRDKKRGDR